MCTRHTGQLDDCELKDYYRFSVANACREWLSREMMTRRGGGDDESRV